ncbi:CheR family methyltransferase [Trichlorobacter ammonificans]|uniref:Chemotaxis protein methyltransferase CheR n=1 Tax=Trichlorobacter ammonificans TaxID=2916410 RepID=A0ABM9D7U6_9BACT|nr:CheR family methyltransferase [Trichlorobacter ammonificans]CAH2031227.1 Chemotaxis protein methyltransferase CheR [Trichlorobacter ammonificans]
MAFTFFFRDLPVLEYAVEATLKLALGRLRIKVWDAGCALGQEPYTLAILFAERMGEMGFNTLYLDATDYDRENNFGDIVTAGEYKTEELQRIPSEIFTKYFEESAKRPGYHKVIDRIRNRVFFKYNDLLELQPVGSDYSLIVCKNVLLHFSYEQRIEVLKMYHRSLAPGGYFATENTQKIPAEISRLFEQVTPDAQLFRKSDA